MGIGASVQILAAWDPPRTGPYRAWIASAFPPTSRSQKTVARPDMHLITARTQLSPNVTRLDVVAPRIAEIRRPGQFVIVRRAAGAERIPLTIADADPAGGHDRPGDPGRGQEHARTGGAAARRDDPGHLRAARAGRPN